MLRMVDSKSFGNGVVYKLETIDGLPIETTDTYLPFYTKDAVGRKQNTLESGNCGSRSERWMIGVSCMSGCPVGCKICATGKLDTCASLDWDEIVQQVLFIQEKYSQPFESAAEHKINYTRMGEPFLNIDEVRTAIWKLENLFPGTHHYLSTIGIKDSDFSWIKGNISLQISLHSLDEERRNNLIPIQNKMSIKELGQIRTNSNLKTTVNLTLADEKDFDIVKLKKYFDPEFFFIKLSPININDVSIGNGYDTGIIKGKNLL